MYNRKKRIVFAGGGSGGHLIPGISLAQGLQKLIDWEMVFIVPGKEIDIKIMKNYHYRYFTIYTRSLANPFLQSCNLLSSFWHGEMLLRKIRPSLIVGLGGYGSFVPAVLAKIHNIPLFFLEGNIIAGKVVRLCSPWSAQVFGQENIAGIPKNKVFSSGIPLRSGLFEVINKKENTKFFKILVVGGSQGSATINRVIGATLQQLIHLPIKVKVVHIVGKDDVKYHVKYHEKCYSSHNLVEYSAKPFISDVKEMYSEVNLVISRSGASTLSEITALGIPSILIPFEKSTDNHQVRNALYMKNNGAAEMIEEKNLTPELLASTIFHIITNKNYAEDMANSTLKLGKPDATINISAYIHNYIVGKKL